MTARDEPWPQRRSRLIGVSITALDPMRDSAERIKVRAGRLVVAVLRSRDVGELGLGIGTTLDRAKLDAIHVRTQYLSALDAALRYLRHRARSEAEMRTHLIGRGFDAAQINSVVERLRELRLLDDRSFAHEAIEQVQRRLPAGERLMRDVLERHGVGGEIAGEVLGQVREQSPPAEQQARALIESRLEAMQSLAPETQARRLMALLGRRGFEEELAERLVREIVGLID